MPSHKGRPKPAKSGRKKGTSIANSLREYFETRNVDLIGKAYHMIEVAEQHDPCRAVESMLKLLEFAYPKARESGLDLNQMTVEQLRQFGGLVLETVRSRLTEVDEGPRTLIEATKEDV